VKTPRKTLRKFEGSNQDSERLISVGFPSYFITTTMNLSSMHDFNEAETGMMSDITKRLRKSHKDFVEVRTHRYELIIYLLNYPNLLPTCSFNYFTLTYLLTLIHSFKIHAHLDYALPCTLFSSSHAILLSQRHSTHNRRSIQIWQII
jgi:hypothetical protein